jgi:sugar transferase (PEP-CTERM/EpsH1 system associated)
MRILFLAHRLPYPPNKGDKIRSCWQLRSLAERYPVDLACFYDQSEDEKYIAAVARCCEHCYVEKLSFVQSRLRATTALFQGQPFSTAYFHSRRMKQAIAGALRSRKYDVIFVFSSSMAHYVADVEGVPKILDMVDVDSEKWAQYGRTTSGPLAWLWRYEAGNLGRYEKEIVGQFSATLLCTKGEADLLHSRTASDKICVVGNALDTDYFDRDRVVLPAEITNLQPYVVFSGAMDYRPNVDAVSYFCREILPLARQKVPSLGFVIAGMNPCRQVKLLGADKGVRITGSVTDIRPYLHGAAAAVIPLRLARGIQNKVLESLAMGLPVITTSAVAECLPDAILPFLFTEDEPQGFATRVASVVSSGFRPPYDQVRRSLELEYGSGRVIDKMVSVLNTVARGGTPESRPAEAMAP